MKLQSFFPIKVKTLENFPETIFKLFLTLFLSTGDIVTYLNSFPLRRGFFEISLQVFPLSWLLHKYVPPETIKMSFISFQSHLFLRNVFQRCKPPHLTSQSCLHHVEKKWPLCVRKKALLKIIFIYFQKEINIHFQQVVDKLRNQRREQQTQRTLFSFFYFLF